MIYPEIFEYKIGFDKIRQLVSSRCLSALGEEKVSEMAFSSDYDFIRKQLHRIQEFTRIIQEEDRFPAGHFFDIRVFLKKVRIEGTYLTERELFDLRRSLETVNDILRFFQSKEPAAYPHLQELTLEVDAFPKLAAQMDLILDKFGKIKDNASPELLNLKKQLAQTVGSISKTLNSILRAAQSEGWVDKDVTPAMRDGRLVVPVAPAFKRKLKGIVHDESATGKTVFIEPAEVVEANNKIRELENEEKREVIRILTAFTDRLRPEIPGILHACRFLAEIDFIRAKALFGLDIHAIFPVTGNLPQMDWSQAVHPLLFLSHRKADKPVVPLDITLTADSNRILVVSGPNAGGKSVLLKTVGLLQYMLQCGLAIPVNERSAAGIFKDIFLDIGDEQSIENDLSTYSSHLANMKFMVKHVNPQSLILIDEFGSGTEPLIGGAIAEALLHRFNGSRCFGIITTHYQNLKTFAEDHEGIVNGAMLYDRNEMRPLFRLAVGRPGSSFAIEIARKTGLPESVIAEASEKVGQDYIDMDRYLQDIVRDKRYWEAKRQNIRQQEKRLEELTAHYTSELEKTGSLRKEIMSKAKADAEQLLAAANARIENTIKEIKEAQAAKEKTKEVRKELAGFKQSLQGDDVPDSKISRKANKIKDRSARKKTSPEADDRPGGGIVPGSCVRIKGQQTLGEVLEVKGKHAIVIFGALKSSVKIDLLEQISGNRRKEEAKRTHTSAGNNPDFISEKKLHFKPEIDVRGMRGEEALQAVIYYVDDAIQCNAGRIRILHGTGTGALRQIIRDYLKTVSGVDRFHDEHVQFGGTGITVVDLK